MQQKPVNFKPDWPGGFLLSVILNVGKKFYDIVRLLFFFVNVIPAPAGAMVLVLDGNSEHDAHA